MKCLLVIPPWSSTQTHPGYVNQVTGATMPGGVTYLAACLREDGHFVEIMDGHFVSNDDIVKRLKKNRHDLLGISCVCALWKSAISLIKAVSKEINHSLYIVAGGQGPSGMGADCLTQVPELDAIVIGEGEHVICQLIRNITKPKELEKIPGLIFRHGKDIVKGPSPKPIEDLDALPFPAIDLIPIDKYIPAAAHYRKMPVATITSSRGCPNGCMYCYRIAGNTIRMRRPANVVDEMLFDYKIYGAREIIFWDEHFTYDKDRVMEICDRLKVANRPVIWWCAGRVDSVDEELLRAMRKAGCYQILYGVESGSERVLDFIGKNTNKDLIHNAVHLAKKCGIKVYGTFMLGLPTETYDEAMETIKFAIELNPDIAEFFPTTPFIGTELAKRVEEFGVLADDTDQLGMHLACFVPYTMTREQLLELRRKSNQYFYFRFRYIFNQLIRIQSWTEVKDIYKGGKTLITELINNKENRK
jgi:radical SAM superfamily enzyme YgiQ (UPF0313 family)